MQNTSRSGCSGSGHEQLFLSPSTNSRLDWDVGFHLATPEHLRCCACVAFSVRLNRCFWKINLPPSRSSLADWVRLSLEIFFCPCSLCLYKPSRTCCWEASHSRTLSPPCISMEMLCWWGRAVFSNCQTYHWVWCQKSSIFCLWQQRTFFSWLQSSPRASGRIPGESSSELFFFSTATLSLPLSRTSLTGEEHRQRLVYAQSTKFFIVDRMHFLAICTKWWIFSIRSRFLFDFVRKFSQQRHHRTKHGCAFKLWYPRERTRKEI